MFQCPYFFFDIIYIHNGTEEKEDDMNWKVRCHHGTWRGQLGTSDLDLPLSDVELVIQPFNNHFLYVHFELVVRTWEATALAAQGAGPPGHTVPSTPPYP